MLSWRGPEPIRDFYRLAHCSIGRIQPAPPAPDDSTLRDVILRGGAPQFTQNYEIIG